MRMSEDQLSAYQARRGVDPFQQIIERNGFTPSVSEYPISPVAKPRMTQRDKWKHRPAVDAYMAFKDECRSQGVKLGTNGEHITFIIAMPQSWSKKKRAEMDGRPHQQRPDWDNFAKAIFDAVMGEDCKVWDCRVSKRWGQEGKIIIRRISK